MVMIIELQEDKTVSPEEFEDYVLSEIDLGDFDSVASSAQKFRQLANDRTFVLEAYHNEVLNLVGGTAKLALSPQSIYILRNDHFLLRSNIWLPRPTDNRQALKNRDLYSYDLPHDHNFDFMTVGYFGPGYETDLYTYDRSSLTGWVGERATLEYLGRETLSPGRIMMYKAGVDVHNQFEPEEVSVSLNLMPLNMKHLNTPQFVFDTKTSKLSGGVSDQVASRLFVLDFFRYIHDENSIDLLSYCSEKHDCPRTSGYALNVLESLRPDEGEYFRNRCPKPNLQFSRTDMVSASHNR